MPKPSVRDQLTRADQLQAAIVILKQEIQLLEASGNVASPGCRVMRYQVKTKKGKYWYYKLQALEPIFPTNQGEGKLSKYKHLGKAGSPAHIGAVLQVAKRNQIDELQRAINSLSDSWLEVVFEQEKDDEKAESK
ncbi:MAG: transposase [Xenococcaceae cyanobacterium]